MARVKVLGDGGLPTEPIRPASCIVKVGEELLDVIMTLKHRWEAGRANPLSIADVVRACVIRTHDREIEVELERALGLILPTMPPVAPRETTPEEAPPPVTNGESKPTRRRKRKE